MKIEEELLMRSRSTRVLVIKKVFLQHLGYTEDEIRSDKPLNIIISDDVGKHGNFISFWKNKKEKEEEEEKISESDY